MTTPDGSTLLESLLIHVSLSSNVNELLAPFMDGLTVAAVIDGQIVAEKKLMELPWWVPRNFIPDAQKHLPTHLTFAMFLDRPIRAGQEVTADVKSGTGQPCPIDLIMTAELRLCGEMIVDDEPETGIPELPRC